MSMYKELYKTLFNRMMDAMNKIDETVVETKDREVRKNLYEIYSILSSAQQEVEEIIMSSEEEI